MKQTQKQNKTFQLCRPSTWILLLLQHKAVISVGRFRKAEQRGAEWKEKFVPREKWVCIIARRWVAMQYMVFNQQE